MMVTTLHPIPEATRPEPHAVPSERLDGRFVLLDRLGAGGMAEVWQARDERTGEIVAIKRLHPHLRADDAALERFRREAEAGEVVRHPRAVTVREARIDRDEAYLVMDYVAGGSLADRLQRDRTVPVLAAVRFASDVAEGLAAAHGRGIVHRDVTASNILLDPTDGARIADFGIALPADDLCAVTAIGDIVGTLRAMAPEVLAGEPATPASDVWSLGAVLYESVVGRGPYVGASPATLLAARQVRPSPVDGLPDALNALLMRMLDPDPARRPADGREAAAALRIIVDQLSNEHVASDDVTREMPIVVAPVPGAGGPTPSSDEAPRPLVSRLPGEGSRARSRGRRVPVALMTLAAAAILGFAVLAAGPLTGPASESTPLPADISPAATPAPALEDSDDEPQGDEAADTRTDKEKGGGKGKGEDNGRGKGRGD